MKFYNCVHFKLQYLIVKVDLDASIGLTCKLSDYKLGSKIMLKNLSN